MSADERALVRLAELALFLGKHERTIRKWIQFEQLPVERREGRALWFYGPDVVDWMIARATGSGLSLERERARLAAAQADATELKLAQERGEWVPVDEIAAPLARVFTEVRTRLLRIPRALAPRLIGVKEIPTVEIMVDDAVREALGALNSQDVFSACGIHCEPDAPAEVDDPGVGGPLPAPASGDERGAGAVADR